MSPATARILEALPRAWQERRPRLGQRYLFQSKLSARQRFAELRASTAETPGSVDVAPIREGHKSADLSRTLRELYERHGVSDEQLAALLGCAPDDAARQRAAASALGVSDGAGGSPPNGAECADEALVPAAPVVEKGNPLDKVIRGVAGVYLLALLGAVFYYKSTFIQVLNVSPLLSGYGLVVVLYISSRFFFSAFYRPSKDHGLAPHVAIVMPGLNEEAAIARSLRSLLELNYPADKLELVAVNDGSTDNTLSEMRKVAATAKGRVRVISFAQNRGKRAAMAAGIRATEAEIVVFVDSDSVLDPDSLRFLVQGFHDRRVGAICGHAQVLNVRENWTTKMQAVRYFVAFSVNKAAESVFNVVTCCSGCFAAYRREAIMPHLD